MARTATPPDDVTLLPQLLACLPGSTIPGSQPPPALLPLLSPILRQRVQLLSTPSDNQSSWLPLLCWNQSLAARLPAIISGLDIEPHPASGEIEPPEVESVTYRRSDKETLHARLSLPDHSLLPVYLWCTGDPQGGADGWRLAELLPLDHETLEDATNTWLDSIERVEARWAGGGESHSTNGSSTAANATLDSVADSHGGDEDNDDDSYWAMYDQTPGRTPKRPSPAPGPTDSAVHLPTTSEMAYFARYAAEVQPAMDPHDPSEEQPGTESTLNGTALGSLTENGIQLPKEGTTTTSHTNAEAGSSTAPTHPTRHSELDQPHPVSPSENSTTNSLERLEQAAERHSHAEIGVKQHISTSIKSMYRLAYAAGIERTEFERIVRTELDVLSMMNMEEE